MERRNFEKQVMGFTQSDPTIIERAMQTVADYYENPQAFSDSIANAPSPEHLWNLAVCAKHYNDVNVAIVIRTVAQTNIHITSSTINLVKDTVISGRMRDDLQNYKHVIALLDSV